MPLCGAIFFEEKEPKLKYQVICLITVSLLSYFEYAIAQDIYHSLESGDLSYIELKQAPENLKCDFTFDLFEETDTPVIFFISSRDVVGNKLSVLWELRELPEFLENSTWEDRKNISGLELNSVLTKFPQFRRDWHFHSGDRTNIKVHLSSISGYPLPINGEIHLILNFNVASGSGALSDGILSSKRLSGVSAFNIREETAPEKIALVKKFINDSGLFNGSLETVYRFGFNVLHVQWLDKKLERRFERPYPILLAEVDGNLYLYRDIGTISSYEMSSGEYSETLEYLAAYDINGDKLPETQHRYLGRYSSLDSFSSFTKEGEINCGRMTLGSD